MTVFWIFAAVLGWALVIFLLFFIGVMLMATGAAREIKKEEMLKDLKKRHDEDSDFWVFQQKRWETPFGD